MSISLILQRDNPISFQEILDVTKKAQQDIPLLSFKQVGPDSLNCLFDGVTKCLLTLSSQDSKIEINTSSDLYKYLNFFTALFGEGLKASVFDPQNMKNVPIESLTTNLEDLKVSPEEKLDEKAGKDNHDINEAIKIIAQIEIGLIDHSKPMYTTFLLNNNYGPVTIPVVKRNNNKDYLEIVKKEFKDKYSIDLNSEEYILVYVKKPLAGSATYVAFKKPE